MAGATLFHSTLADGVRPQAAPTAADGWLLLPTAVPMDVAMQRIGQRVGLGYDWISLLAFRAARVGAVEQGRLLL